MHADVSMKLLLDGLASVQQLYNLGLHLGVPESDLDEIEVNYSHLADIRRATLRKWLKTDDQPSWSKLVEALVAINERHVARTIAEKYGIFKEIWYIPIDLCRDGTNTPIYNLNV